MTYSRKTIKVKDIVEYPTQLGNKCKLMSVNDLNPYSNTEEEVMDFLINSSKDPDNLKICKESCRCSGFWKEYETCFMDKIA